MASNARCMRSWLGACLPILVRSRPNWIARSAKSSKSCLLDSAVLTAVLDEYYDGALTGYAEQMAALAVRRRSRDVLASDIAAAGIAGSVPGVDIHDVIPIHSLLWHSAVLLGLNPRNEFLVVANELDGEGGELVEGFAYRTPEKMRLEVTYYEESEAEDGLIYRRVPRVGEVSDEGLRSSSGSAISRTLKPPRLRLLTTSGVPCTRSPICLTNDS